MHVRWLAVVGVVAAPIVACGGPIAIGAHATQPLSPADGAGDWTVAGGPPYVAPRVPGPELPQHEPNVHPVLVRAMHPSTGAFPTTSVWPPPQVWPR